MYHKTIDYFAELANRKTNLFKKKPEAIVIGAIMGGMYVGIGIILIFSLASSAEPGLQKLIMGAAFGITLTLAVFAGADIFTAYIMYMPFALLRGQCSYTDLVKMWSVIWVFNLMGSLLLVYIFSLGGGGDLAHTPDSLLMRTAEYKVNSSPIELLARAILCNWLLCLALWMAARTKDDSAKCILIFWCLLAFMACGFENSIANMTLFSIALLGNHSESLSISGMFYNLFWVTFGNAIGGVALIVGTYWAASPPIGNLNTKIKTKLNSQD